MNSISISATTARKIAGNREAVLPLEYTHAVTALQACRSIDEAKYWSDKADALAAWAKMYSNSQADREARKLKLHAFRRMGILAEEIRPTLPRQKGIGSQPGGRSILVEKGLTKNAAGDAVLLGRQPDEAFEAHLASRHVPSPRKAVLHFNSLGATEAWNTVIHGINGGGNASFASIARMCRKHSPQEIAQQLKKDEILKARDLAIEIGNWFDEFERFLPK